MDFEGSLVRRQWCHMLGSRWRTVVPEPPEVRVFVEVTAEILWLTVMSEILYSMYATATIMTSDTIPTKDAK